MYAIYRNISPNKIFVNICISYFQDTCNTDFPINNKTRKFKSFAFIKPPAHVTDEIIKLKGIAYRDNELRIEDATLTRKRINNNTSYESQRPSVVVNNYPENQYSSERKSSASESKFSKRNKQIVIFGENIPCGISLRKFNYWLQKRYAQLKSFSGGTSNELLYYVEPTLKTKKLTWLHCMLVLMTYLMVKAKTLSKIFWKT